MRLQDLICAFCFTQGDSLPSIYNAVLPWLAFSPPRCFLCFSLCHLNTDDRTVVSTGAVCVCVCVCDSCVCGVCSASPLHSQKTSYSGVEIEINARRTACDWLLNSTLEENAGGVCFCKPEMSWNSTFLNVAHLHFFRNNLVRVRKRSCFGIPWFLLENCLMFRLNVILLPSFQPAEMRL